MEKKPRIYEKARVLTERGRQKKDFKTLEKALETYNKGLKKHPDNIHLLNGKGECLNLMGLKNKKHYKQAIKECFNPLVERIGKGEITDDEIIGKITSNKYGAEIALKPKLTEKQKRDLYDEKRVEAHGMHILEEDREAEEQMVRHMKEIIAKRKKREKRTKEK